MTRLSRHDATPSCRVAGFLPLVLLLSLTAHNARATDQLWELGKADGTNAGFALEPSGYEQYSADGFHIVGHSDPQRDWPYVHPGPLDDWAGERPHTFAVVFGIDRAPTEGEACLHLDLLDTHNQAPPVLQVDVNGQKVEQPLPLGKTDDSIRGHPERGQRCQLDVKFPATWLQAGNNRLALTTISGSWFLYGRLALEAPEGVKSRPVQEPEKIARLPVPRSNVKQVIVVFKTHFDIGYTDMAANIVTKYRTTMIDQALEVVDRNRDLPADRQFVWTIPGWPMHKILEDWPGQSPERKKRVEQAVCEGRFVMHALPFTTHTELLEAEDLVRGLGYSSRITHGLGLPLPRDAKMTDVPEHTRMLPTLLRHAGVDFMHIGCNGLSTPLGVPPLFWWQGPDGSRVLTMYSKDYGTGLIPPSDWPFGTWLALIHTGDNHGPPRPEEVKAVLDQAAKRLPEVTVKIGRLSDFADAILAEKPDLPVITADSPDTWIHGPMSDPQGMAIARSVRPMIPATEALDTEMRAWGVKVPDVSSTIAAAYEQSLLYGEHTWGGSIAWIGNKLTFGEEFQKARAEGKYERIESSWKEHTSYIEKARDLISPLYVDRMKVLAANVAMDGDRIVVFNPLPWRRDGVVFVVLPGTNPPVDFIAHHVPPLGYKVYKWEDVLPKENRAVPEGPATVLENERFRVTLAPDRGVVQSIVDKHTGQELIDTKSPYGFGQYLYERFDKNQVSSYCETYPRQGFHHFQDFDKPGLPLADQFPYRAASPEKFVLSAEGPGASSTRRMTAAASNGLPEVWTRVVLHDDEPYFDITITIFKKPADSWPEAGWLCLPFAVDQPQFRLGRLGSILDPARDILPNANRDIFALNTGMMITGPDGRGVGLCPIDHPLVSLERPGCWKYSHDFTPSKSTVFVNLFNNQWNTNFRLWNSGTWTSRVRIWSVEPGANTNTALITPALEARFPLMAVHSKGPAGKLPTSQSGLELSRKGISVTAFGANPDGPGTILRLWELAGESGPCRVRLPEGLAAKNAQPVNLRGQPEGDPIAIDKTEFTVNVPAFAPVSVVLDTRP